MKKCNECGECEIYKKKIVKLESALHKAFATINDALDGEAPKPKDKAKPSRNVNWFEEMDLFQQANDEFIKAWDAFVKHRKELRKSLTLTQGQRIISKLSSRDLPTQIKALYTSVDNGWIGCDPDWVSHRDSKQGEVGYNIANQTEVRLEDL